jgi:hypothetical protein
MWHRAEWKTQLGAKRAAHERATADVHALSGISDQIAESHFKVGALREGLEGAYGMPWPKAVAQLRRETETEHEEAGAEEEGFGR